MIKQPMQTFNNLIVNGAHVLIIEDSDRTTAHPPTRKGHDALYSAFRDLGLAADQLVNLKKNATAIIRRRYLPGWMASLEANPDVACVMEHKDGIDAICKHFERSSGTPLAASAASRISSIS